MTAPASAADSIYAKAIHYLLFDLSQSRTEYRDPPPDWLREDDATLTRLLCLYFVKHARGDMLEAVETSFDAGLPWETLFKAALFFSIRDGTDAPLAALRFGDLDASQRRLAWGLRAMLALARGNGQRALRQAALCGIQIADRPTTTEVAPIARQARLQSEFGSITLMAGDSTVVKLF